MLWIASGQIHGFMIWILSRAFITVLNRYLSTRCRCCRCWYLLFVLSRQGLSGGSGPQHLTRALGIETGNPIMTFEQRSGFLPSVERAPHHTATGIPEGRCSFASTLSLALPNPLFPLWPPCLRKRAGIPVEVWWGALSIEGRKLDRCSKVSSLCQAL